MTRARYDQLEPTIYPIPGTVFQSSTALSAVTPGLTAGVVGTVGPVTAQELSQLGAPYTAQDDVGQTGLEQADERQLAGTPGATVSVVSASGAHVATVATLPSHPGTPVTTTIQPSVQRAAEAALAGEKKSAALVAVNASTGAVLAAVSANSGFDQAIDGGFPPGSTFKVITSTALISRGLKPAVGGQLPGHGHGRRRGVPQRRGRGAGEQPDAGVHRVVQHRLHQAGYRAPVAAGLPGGGGDVRAGQEPAHRADRLRRVGPAADRPG